MSHLHEILNHDHGRPSSSKLDDRTEPVVDQLDISSSAEDDISPGSDDEIDELEDESDGEMDYYDEESSTPLGTAIDHPLDTPTQHESTDGSKIEPNLDSFPLRKEEKRPEPAPRRKLEKHDRKIDLGLHDHKAHADCPDTLACLPDTHGRPQHTLPVILRCAILGSPRKRLTIREIYATMESKYPYYKTAGQTWKQSVRHHLSLNRLFERQPRPVTDPGFGSYWTVNLSAPPGTKRPRKRGRPNKDGAEGSVSKKPSPHKNQSQSQLELQLTQPLKFQFQPQTHPPPPPPPVPQPQTNAFAPRPPHHHHQTMHPTLLNHSPSLSEYHSPPESHSHPSQQAQPSQSLPPASSSSSSSTPQNHHRHEHQLPNHYQNHRQHQTRPPPHQHNSLPPSHIPPHPSLSPSIPQPQSTLSAHSHHYSQQQQQNHPPHQRPHQDHYPPPSQHLPHHSSQIVPSQSRPPLNHSHSQPLSEHHDVRRQSVSYSSQRKSSLPINSARESTYPLSSRDSEVDDMMTINAAGIRNGPTISDDEYESEEDTDNHHRRRAINGVFVPTKPSPIFSLPPFSVLTPPHRQELLEQMRQEIATLRRTSAEAVSTSIRLSEQLANANLEVSRSREAVRDLEDMLQDEAAKRKELEKMRTLEMERRRAAEDALSSTIRSPARVRAT